MFGGLIARGSINGPELSLPGNAALELSFHFFGGALLQRVDASGQQKGAGQGESHRKALHSDILEKGLCIARKEQMRPRGHGHGGL